MLLELLKSPLYKRRDGNVLSTGTTSHLLASAVLGVFIKQPAVVCSNSSGSAKTVGAGSRFPSFCQCVNAVTGVV